MSSNGRLSRRIKHGKLSAAVAAHVEGMNYASIFGSVGDI